MGESKKGNTRGLEQIFLHSIGRGGVKNWGGSGKEGFNNRGGKRDRTRETGGDHTG